MSGISCRFIQLFLPLLLLLLLLLLPLNTPGGVSRRYSFPAFSQSIFLKSQYIHSGVGRAVPLKSAVRAESADGTLKTDTQNLQTDIVQVQTHSGSADRFVEGADMQEQVESVWLDH